MTNGQTLDQLHAFCNQDAVVVSLLRSVRHGRATFNWCVGVWAVQGF
jgi:hypothetical protein